jgi:hypothetical protein
MRKARRPVRSAAIKVEPLPPNRSRMFSPGLLEYSSARPARPTGFSVKWIMCCGVTFLMLHRSVALFGPKYWWAAPSRQP